MVKFFHKRLLKLNSMCSKEQIKLSKIDMQATGKVLRGLSY